MVKLSSIQCSIENHRNMKYEYLCLNENCLENNHELCCLYCCEEFHKDHMTNITSMKSILSQMEGLKGKKGFDLLSILLQGIENCINFNDLRKIFAEILGYRKNPNRYEDLLDQQMKDLHKKALKHYQRQEPIKTTKSNSQKSSRLIKGIVSPVLTFKQGNGYTLNSPFSVTSTNNEITTILGFPSLSKFYQSISITLKIDRYTPSWLALGVSIGQSKYEDKSPKHLLAISNGWVANKGEIQKSNFRFGSGDEIKIRWDKNMELLEFLSPKREKITHKFQNKWNQDIYFCVCLFYKGDSVHLLG